MKGEDLVRILLAFFVLVVIVLLSCTPTSESDPVNIEEVASNDNASANMEEPPPLIVDMDTPLLLDEPGEGEKVAATNTKATAENTACFVCHANYMTESLVGDHAGVDIGCVHCHGQSTVHRNDENNTTPPEIMYPVEKVDPFCRGCHSTVHDIPPRKIITRWLERNKKEDNPSCANCHKEDDVPPVKVVARWKERGLDKAKTDPDKIICTDCHGEHRMRIRTVIWDKKSGKLLRTNRED